MSGTDIYVLCFERRPASPTHAASGAVPPLIAAMIRRAMALGHGWDRAAATYEYYYRLAVVRKHSH